MPSPPHRPWWHVAVLVISIGIDETNLLKRLHPAPQSDESVVRCILTYVMPLAVLVHLGAAQVSRPHRLPQALTSAAST